MRPYEIGILQQTTSADPGVRRHPTTAPAAVASISTTATAIASATATTAEPAAPASATLLSRARFVDVQGSAVHLPAIHCLHCVGSLVTVRHFDEGKPAGLTSVPIADDGNSFDCAIGAEHSLKLALSGLIREVSHKNIRHSNLLELRSLLEINALAIWTRLEIGSR